MRARVYVTLKKEVLDPQGDAVSRALQRLDFSAVDSVRQGKVFEITLQEQDPKAAREMLHAMCEKLLANQVIETFDVNLLENTS